MKKIFDVGGAEVRLTEKEFRFAEHYLCSFNATEAAKEAGYSHHSARQQGYQNLTKPYIKEYLQHRASPHLKSLEVTQERIIKELATIAFSNVGDFLNSDWSLKNLEDLGNGKTGAIKTVKKSENGHGLQLFDKLAALEKLWELTNINGG
ncbi:terminase small subunit [Cyclobacterium sp. 1_MG-2023]|uniref:terminase small subunit n=1 Tax=Cyclobacterium sp. 1_MG-2023 TaxID=3062681 RepID=UPI0026E34CDD|nr:terminase small subunit [Cyclobacterium sp. 1_MG-2023]MDO6436283.1 terminase small subunit [Cyclobacterium sp. 1_MG-2023]